jgi:hypothetical protein
MSQNPLQQFFRQPKVYITLPSKGVFNSPDTLSGSFENLPVYGMTGMDEIILKTPDALMTGESTVKLIQSCCPSIKDAWALTTLDTNMVYAAIRIATYGHELSVTQTCTECETENDFDIDLNHVVEHYSNCQYNHKLILDGLTVKTRPLTFKESNDFSLENYGLQQKLNQADQLEDVNEKQKLFKELFEELSVTQQRIFSKSVEAVEVGDQVVTDPAYIEEWLKNCDKSVFEKLKNHVDANRTAWDMPTWPSKCEKCGAESKIYIELDNSSFFDNA